MRALLDVNVLLALMDSQHIHHEVAHGWLDRNPDQCWASCALTQNGFTRVISQPSYPHSLTPGAAIEMLERACDTPRHAWWPCDVSLIDTKVVDRARVHGTRQVTDVYLLALAVMHGGCLVTFDRSIALTAVPAATEEHLVVL